MEELNTKREGFFSRLKSKIALALVHFSKNEWRLFLVLLVVCFVSVVWLLTNINNSFLVRVPMRGGELSEGLVGTPRFINPVLAFSDTDRDMVSLVYSGLMRKDQNGEYVPDLAASYEVSEDGLTYTFVIKDGATFHSGEKVTADDVVFTVESVSDPVIKSPRRASWEGISVEKVDDRTVAFNLAKPYAGFLENATLGILPSHVWRDSPIELHTANMNPIGAGPYKVSSISKDSDGIATSYTLAAFSDWSLGKPYIKKLTLKFYENEDALVKALASGEVAQASSLSPENAVALKDKGYRIETSALPRVFGLFFNQNQNQLFVDKSIMRAMDLAIDKDKIVREVLLGYGTVIDSPMPKNLIPYESLSKADESTQLEKLEQAQAILEKDGWVKGEDGFLSKTKTENKKTSTSLLEFSISTGNAPELTKAAELIQSDLAKIGIKVEVKTFELGNLNQLVIRPRKYDALLFGQIINTEADLYAFWHSSQRKDPGLNVAMYTNAKVDKILEDVSGLKDEAARVKKYAEFEKEVREDLPAIFLYSPNLIYAVSKDVQGLSIDHIASQRERFLDLPMWYTKEDNVWKIFSK